MATLDATAAGGLEARADAIGGSAGGPFPGAGPPVSGADATAIAKGTLTSDGDGSGAMHVSARANGGGGYPFLDPLRPDIGGVALARASGTETFTGAIWASRTSRLTLVGAAVSFP